MTTQNPTAQQSSNDICMSGLRVYLTDKTYQEFRRRYSAWVRTYDALGNLEPPNTFIPPNGANGTGSHVTQAVHRS